MKFNLNKVMAGLMLNTVIFSSMLYADELSSEASKQHKVQDDEHMQKIVVFGQKIDRTIQETESSLSVITDETLSNNADQSTISEILRGIANINFAGNTDAPIIRGIDTKGPISAGNAYLARPVSGATISVDGRYVTPSELNLGAAGIWDVSSIEVYRGPQTTSQGANSIAGAVVINTRKPTFDTQYAAQLLAGSRNKQRASAMISGSPADDFAARIAVDYSARDTFIDYTNPEFTANDFDLDWKNKNMRAKLLWEPSNNDKLSMMFTYSYNKVNRPYDEVASLPYDDLDNTSLSQDKQETSNHVGIFDLSYQLTSNVVLHNQMQYSEGEFAFTFAEPFAGLAERTNDNFSNEIRLNFGQSSDEFSGVVGFFYWEDKANNKLNNTFGHADADLGHESMAPYGEIVWNASDNWTLTGGLRYQMDEISHEGEASYVPDTYHQYEEDFNALLPKVSIAYHFNDNATLGLLVNRGYIPGGTGINFTGGTYYDFDPEYAWNYEVYSRHSLLDASLLINANVFYTKFKDSQRSVTDYLDGRAYGSVIISADEAESYGLELELTYRANDALSFTGGLGLLETEVNKFADYRGEQFVGKEFGKAPGIMANVGVEYEVTSALRVNANVRFTDSYYSDDANTPELVVSSYHVANLNLSYQYSPNIDIFAYARNLFDERVPLRKVLDRSLNVKAYMLEPREIGVGVRMKY